MKTKYTIPDHWDTIGLITAESNAIAEYALWKAHDCGEWRGDEFTLATFEAYIDKLKEQEATR
jgi:hypothetical protein